MKLDSLNQKPHALQTPQGETILIATTGIDQASGMLWIWPGDDHLITYRKGEYTEDDKIESDGKFVGWVNQVSDIPEIPNPVQIEAFWHETRERLKGDGELNAWLENEIQLHAKSR